MEISLIKYIPPDVRLNLTQDLIEKRGIRPLARQIDVNPKSVYKYKQGTSCPGDEVMEKIISVASDVDEELLNEYFKRVRDDFMSSWEETVNRLDLLGKKVKEDRTPVGKQSTKEEKRTHSKTEEKETPKSEMSEEEIILNKLEIKDSFKKTKVKKILQVLEEEKNLSSSEIVELTSLSEEAVEKYLEKMESEGIGYFHDDGKYELKKNVVKKH